MTKPKPVRDEPVGVNVLRCGHAAKGAPTTSNPDRWWCCGAFQKKAGWRPK